MPVITLGDLSHDTIEALSLRPANNRQIGLARLKPDFPTRLGFHAGKIPWEFRAIWNGHWETFSKVNTATYSPRSSEIFNWSISSFAHEGSALLINLRWMKRGDSAWTTWILGTYSSEEWKIFSANEQMTFNVISFVHTDSPVSVLGDLNAGGTRSKAGNWSNRGIVKFGCYIDGGL